jgi:hypothetical protein
MFFLNYNKNKSIKDNLKKIESNKLNKKKKPLQKQQIQNNVQKQQIQNNVQNNVQNNAQNNVQNNAQRVLQTPQYPQNRVVYDKNSKKIETRTIIPVNKMININNNLNMVNTKKTIIHVLDNSNGFGDFLRGSILLAEYAKYFKINFRMDMSRHSICKFLEYEQPKLLHSNKPKLICFNGGDTDKELKPLLVNFINSNSNNFYITTNLYYNINILTNDIKCYINSILKFKEKYYKIAKDLIKMEKYKVLHIRCKDDYFNEEFIDNNLIVQIRKLQLGYDTIVMSNNYSIKKNLNKLFGFHFIDKSAVHSGNIIDYTDFESTIIEYIILSKSDYNYCFSYYHHGSGFSQQCSILNDIPYEVIYLPYTNIIQPNVIVTNEHIEDLNLLLNHYDDLLRGNFTMNISKTNKKNRIDYDYNNIAFITLTNTGYLDYTLNCLESLKRINVNKELKVYCIGKSGYEKLKKKGFSCHLINDEENNNFQSFRTGNWSNITYYKFEIIYENLLNNEFVCITDGDIVYENNCFLNYFLDNIDDNDILIQSEGIYNNVLCSGLMFIKSNELTISLFNPKNVEIYKNKTGWDDQIYMNEIKYKLQYKKLPISLFPTGKYYYTYSNKINPYLIHFNWIDGTQKKNKMIEYNKWFIGEKVKIFQHGTDGFGHQLEGIIRLISLSINNKAEYKYNYKKSYSFEHNNFDIEKLSEYLYDSYRIISNEINYLQKEEQQFTLRFNEQRNFNHIMNNDVNWKNTIYFYDGVSSNINGKLPENFEPSIELEKSLPKIREAFVEKNNYLPKKSYDNHYINVCCHIRLGDAVGQRILDHDKLNEVIKLFQKNHNYRVIIHSDGDVSHLATDNTIIYDSKTDVLQVLSDFVFADILIINYSSLSIAAHLLADNKQKVFCPKKAGPTFHDRILKKCITFDDFLKENK